jgi:hypothetical protein
MKATVHNLLYNIKGVCGIKYKITFFWTLFIVLIRNVVRRVGIFLA